MAKVYDFWNEYTKISHKYLINKILNRKKTRIKLGSVIFSIIMYNAINYDTQI